MKTSHKHLMIWAMMAAVYAGMYAWRLGHPPMKYFDEVYQVTTAQQFLALSGYRERAHPPLGMELMAGAISLFGDHPWAWRLVSCLAGFGSLVLIYGITRLLSNNTRMAWLAVMFFGLDGLAITQARIGIVHASMLFWMLLSVWCLLRATEGTAHRSTESTEKTNTPQRAQREDHRDDTTERTESVSSVVSRSPLCSLCWLMGSGLAFGAAGATRWVGFSIGSVLLVLIAQMTQRYREKHTTESTEKSSSTLWRFGGSVVFCFVVLPLLVYFGSYLIVPFLQGHDWSSIWTMQGDMLHLHLTLTASHRYDADWWMWPLLSRPIWYGFERQDAMVNGILCIGNPLITWMIPVGMGYLIYTEAQRRRNTHHRAHREQPSVSSVVSVSRSSLWSLCVLVGFFTQWLQWVGVKRVTFFHYFYTAMPFVAMALAAMVDRLLERGGLSRRLAMAYVAGVVAMAVYWYPLWTGLPIPEWYYRHHLWFSSWV